MFNRPTIVSTSPSDSSSIPSFLRAAVELHDVGVPQGGDRLRLPAEPLPLLRASLRAGRRHFEGDQPFEAQVAGPENDAHAPVAEHHFPG
jgi:hypothetical protein